MESLTSMVIFENKLDVVGHFSKFVFLGLILKKNSENE